ncbi:Aerobic respiration control sensor protein ArcB [Planctomycetes bacterium Pla163]|uniref:histidine kinase n=1 Tax=Rohdeia mirabilis TaxID=2528008 RepID=A0A518D485_9BACT|nr:Aerobic respiration control sensor protein ArcB [Planctomycetes bacterium Pla163]
MLALRQLACPECEEVGSTVAAASSGPFWSRLFDTSDFPARWNCGTWDPTLGWLHIGADLATWAAYLAIPIMLLVVLRRRRQDVPARWLGLLFCAFIVSCGTVHLFEAVIFYWPAYRVAAVLKVITAVVSVVTVFGLARILPHLLELRGPSQLEVEVAARTAALRESELRRAELQHRAERADAAKTRFLATMSHELRSPIAAILGHVELLDDPEHPVDEDELRRGFEAIHRSVDHQLAVINDVLELSKIEAGEIQLELAPLDPNAVVRDAVDIVRMRAERNSNELRVERAVGADWIHSDATRIRQVLVNLLSNAAKFTSEGRIDVAVRVVGERSSEGEIEIEFSVRDTGPGLDAEQCELVFEPYTQARTGDHVQHGGTGLGLPISRRLARALGGDLVLESEPGLGSEFRFTVRARQVPPMEPTEEPRREVARLDGVTVLLVEDQLDLALVASKQLARSGALVTHATSGERALELLGDAGAPFDVVLLDLQLPGIQGDEVLRAARAFGHRGPIVALTANALAERRAACLRMGFDGFATKPLRGPALIELVSANVRGREAA